MSSRILELSQIIAENTKLVDDYFVRHGMPTPSFAIDGPQRIAISPKEEEIIAAQTAVLDATRELNYLMTGPIGVIMGTSIAQALPVGEERTFEELASATGYVAHTAISKLLAESPLLYDFAGITTEERFPSAVKAVDALIRRDGAQCQNPGQSAFSLARNTNRGFYEDIAADPERNKRWTSTMNAFASMLSLDGLLHGFDWTSLGKATVVDVGGGWGPVSVSIARQFADINFIVQDLPEVTADGFDNIPDDFRDRFQFLPYNFITETQPIKGAAIYFFRAILHNWPDQYCLRILRNQIPALKSGSRLIINDSCLHEPKSLPATLEKRRRSLDLNMMTYFGSRERTVGDWEAILKEADPRFHLRSAKKPPHDMNYILDVEWKG